MRIAETIGSAYVWRIAINVTKRCFMPPRARKAAIDAPVDTANSEPEARAPTDNLGLIVGQNMKRLRSRRGHSLEALAKLSGVSRAMLGQIETGRSVPTINVVWKIACAFDVPFSTLIATPNAEQIRVIPAKEAKVLTSASGDFSSRALFPFDGERRTEFYELHLKGRGCEDAEPHASGTTENLVVVQGVLEIDVAGQQKRLEPGDAILFAADQPHSYRNPGAEEAVAYLVMTYVEPAG
jgi:transcriptional regulator with XRE-family HTH domain